MNFESGFKEKLNNNSFNQKDMKGLLILFFIILSIILIILYFIKKQKIYLYIGLPILASCIIFIENDPILILYSFSGIISMFTRTPEFLDKEEFFPNHTKLEDPELLKSIHNNLDKLLHRTNNAKDIDFTKNSFGNNKINKYIGKDVDEENNRGWRLYQIKVGNNFTEHSKRDFPELVKVLSEMDEVKACALSILDEKTKIPIHIGYFKGVMRYMLALKVPKDRENCTLFVNGKTYSWTEDQSVLWDDNYPHKVNNNTNESRIVFYMDIIRPLSAPLSNIRDFAITSMLNSKYVKDEIKKSELKVKI